MESEVKDFNKDIIDRSKSIPVLVDFWAEWCAPCRILGPVLERLAEKYKNRFVLVKVNTDKNPEIAARYGIRGIPNVKLFVDGTVSDEFTGALPVQAVDQWLKKALPGKNASEIEKAKELLNNGEDEKASALLQKLLIGEPDNTQIKLLFARSVLFNDYKTAEKLAIESEMDTEHTELIESIKTIAHLFSLNGSNGSSADLEYKSAINGLKQKNFDLALQKFIDVIKTDRTLDDDGARKACIAIFKLLGEDNEITLKHRRDFGSALYI
ncbi:MAG TPA: thioredoxin [Ignavibacteriaceae bacterium]